MTEENICPIEGCVPDHKYKIKFIQDDDHIVEVIVNEKDLEDTFKTIKEGKVVWSGDKKHGYWINGDRVRAADISLMNISPDPEEEQKEHLHDGADEVDMSE